MPGTLIILHGPAAAIAPRITSGVARLGASVRWTATGTC
jgi:hypothetical protein